MKELCLCWLCGAAGSGGSTSDSDPSSVVVKDASITFPVYKLQIKK